jgi:signal transduction histidine kinase
MVGRLELEHGLLLPHDQKKRDSFSGLAESGSGRGLIGLRERAAVFGGEVHADKLHDGGFAVRARLPLGDIA